MSAFDNFRSLGFCRKILILRNLMHSTQPHVLVLCSIAVVKFGRTQFQALPEFEGF